MKKFILFLCILLSFTIAFACDFEECNSCVEDGCFWAKQQQQTKFICTDNAEDFYTIKYDCNENNHSPNQIFDLGKDFRNSETANHNMPFLKNTTIQKTPVHNIDMNIGQIPFMNKAIPNSTTTKRTKRKQFRLDIPNSTLISSRFMERIMRNQCHSLLHFLRLHKILNTTMYTKTIRQNMMYGKDAICTKILNERRLFYGRPLALMQGNCDKLLTCELCVQECFWLKSNAKSWCSPEEPIQTNITFIPPGFPDFCESKHNDNPIGSQDEYKIPFWVLTSVIIIAFSVGIIARVLKRKRQQGRTDEQFPLTVF